MLWMDWLLCTSSREREQATGQITLRTLASSIFNASSDVFPLDFSQELAASVCLAGNGACISFVCNYAVAG